MGWGVRYREEYIFPHPRKRRDLFVMQFALLLVTTVFDE
jgi:hypothetical protein